MTLLTATMTFELDAGRVYPQLPKGVRPWWAAGTMVGDVSGGLLGMSLALNPNVDRTFDQYFIITRSYGFASVVDPAGIVYVQQQATDWERTAILATNPIIGVLDLKTTGSSLDQWAATDDASKILGRVATGTAGQIWCYAQNVDTVSINVGYAGFVADYPIIGWNDWKA